MTAYTATTTAAVLSAVVILVSPTAGAQPHCTDLGGADGSAAKELDIVPHDYRSDSTETVVLTIGTNTGVRPVTTFRSFTYDVERHTPITINTLFRPDADPLTVLNPILHRELTARGAMPKVLTLDGYSTFALSDDTVTFFFPQGDLLPHVDGPFTIDVPRTQLSSILA
jgi:hypothetical protein